ncbi:DUF805 domain-containing protein [Paenibacillus dauci]|uniref:DUF805 domain-containing protein n=1 Tax=Paenibacillus dauci TaxID=1567106 RepID=UPI000619DBF6|nr:DUF805 domain-containing protein [Paenibacillus dauci]
MSWYISVLKNYVGFRGRASRSEFWIFGLISTIITIALLIIDGILGTERFIASLYHLAVTLPTLAVLIRRLHDTGRSAWWYLLVLIPIVGIIVLLIFCSQDGQYDENVYGTNPKYS